MNRTFTRAASALGLSITFGLASLPVFAQTAKKPGSHPVTKTKTKKATEEVKYKAACGMVYSAADAKKNHYICPMDHKPLVKLVSKTGK